MFFGLMMVDAALAAWAVGLMGQPKSPRWVRFILFLLGITFVVSVGVVTVLTEHADNDTARAWGLIAPGAACVAFVLLLIATLISRRK